MNSYKSNVIKTYRSLLRSCWCQDPEIRPTFATCSKALKEIYTDPAFRFTRFPEPPNALRDGGILPAAVQSKEKEKKEKSRTRKKAAGKRLAAASQTQSSGDTLRKGEGNQGRDDGEKTPMDKEDDGSGSAEMPAEERSAQKKEQGKIEENGGHEPDEDMIADEEDGREIGAGELLEPDKDAFLREEFDDDPDSVILTSYTGTGSDLNEAHFDREGGEARKADDTFDEISAYAPQQIWPKDELGLRCLRVLDKYFPKSAAGGGEDNDGDNGQRSRQRDGRKEVKSLLSELLREREALQKENAQLRSSNK